MVTKDCCCTFQQVRQRHLLCIEAAQTGAVSSFPLTQAPSTMNTTLESTRQYGIDCQGEGWGRLSYIAWGNWLMETSHYYMRCCVAKCHVLVKERAVAGRTQQGPFLHRPARGVFCIVHALLHGVLASLPIRKVIKLIASNQSRISSV